MQRDQRRSARFPISLKIDFFDGTEWNSGFTTDLSQSGFFVHCESLLPKDTLQIFSFPVLEMPTQRLSVFGRVARVSHQRDGAPFTGMGVQFIEVASTVGFAHLYRFCVDLCRNRNITVPPEITAPLKRHVVNLFDFRRQRFHVFEDARLLPDRRDHRRVPFLHSVRYQLEGKDYVGVVTNLSVKGLFVETMERLPEIGDRVFVQIATREADQRIALKLIGGMRWSRIAIPALGFKSGFGMTVETAQVSGPCESYKAFVRARATRD